MRVIRDERCRESGGVVLIIIQLSPRTQVWLDCSGLAHRLHVQGPGLCRFFVSAGPNNPNNPKITRLTLIGLVMSPGTDFDASGTSDLFMRINVACARATLDGALLLLRQVCFET